MGTGPSEHWGTRGLSPSPRKLGAGCGDGGGDAGASVVASTPSDAGTPRLQRGQSGGSAGRLAPPRGCDVWGDAILAALTGRAAILAARSESGPDDLDFVGCGGKIGLETRDERPPFLAGINFLAVGTDEGIARARLVGRHGKRRLAIVKQSPAGR